MDCFTNWRLTDKRKEIKNDSGKLIESVARVDVKYSSRKIGGEVNCLTRKLRKESDA